MSMYAYLLISCCLVQCRDVLTAAVRGGIAAGSSQALMHCEVDAPVISSDKQVPSHHSTLAPLAVLRFE